VTVFGGHDTMPVGTRASSRFDALVASVRRGDAEVRRVDYAGPLAITLACGDAPTLERHADAITAHETPTGLRLDGLINTCDCVYLYEDEDGNQWGELRLAEDVLAPEVLAAWQLCALTDDHPEVFVTPDNWTEIAKGTLGSNVRAADDNTGTLADIAVNDAGLITKVKPALSGMGGKKGLSCGYGCTLVEESGEYNGVPYKFRQTAYVPNHVSVVDEPRGAGCEFIVDGVRSVRPRPQAEQPNEDEKNMKKDAKIMIGEAEHEVPDEVAAEFAAMKAKVEEQGAKLAELAAGGDAEEPVVPPVAAEEAPMADSKAKPKAQPEDRFSNDALAVRLAMLEEQNKKLTADAAAGRDIGQRVSARVRLVADAAKVLGPKVALDEKSDRDIKIAVVAEVTPAAAKMLTADAADSTVDVAYSQALEFFARSQDSSAQLQALTRGAPQHNRGEAVDLNAIAQASMDSLRTNFNRKPASARQEMV
jgi:hypothetical protein